MLSNPTLRFAAVFAVLLATSACQREEAAPAPSPGADAATATAEALPEAEPATIPGTDAISAVDNTQAEAGVQPAAETVAGMEPRSFAGTFSADGATLNLAADGSYTLDGAEGQTGGTWSIEDGGARILLDPNSKDAQDSRYVVVSADALKADGGQVLKRVN